MIAAQYNVSQPTGIDDKHRDLNGQAFEACAVPISTRRTWAPWSTVTVTSSTSSSRG
jgi:hypothetical protein